MTKSLNSKLYAILASAGLAVVLLFTACQDTLSVDETTPFSKGLVRLGETPVAEVDGTQIYLSDVEHRAAAQGLVDTGTSLTSTDPIFRRMLDELIDQRMLALEALRQALDQKDESKRRLSAARERILSNILIETRLADAVNDDTIRRMYETQAKLANTGEERRARHILVADADTLEVVMKRLDAGEDFSTLATEFSIDRASRDNGGDLGYFGRDIYEPTFSKIAFETPIGERSIAFQTSQGWHILMIDNSRRAKMPTLEQIRTDITEYMTLDEIQKLLAGLRAQSEVKRFTVKKNIPGPGMDMENDQIGQTQDSQTPLDELDPDALDLTDENETDE